MREEIQLGLNRIILVGTGHVLQESVDLARDTIREVRPDYVALELDTERLKALESGMRERPRLSDILRMGVRIAVLGTVLSYYQGKVGEETGVFPGADMLEALKTAQDVGANVELIDSNVGITMDRLASQISFLDVLKLIFYVLFPSKTELKDLDEDMVDDFKAELKEMSPPAYRVLVEERDRIMAQNILKLSGTIVVVVGAGHVKGIKENLIETYKKSEKEGMQ